MSIVVLLQQLKLSVRVYIIIEFSHRQLCLEKNYWLIVLFWLENLKKIFIFFLCTKSWHLEREKKKTSRILGRDIVKPWIMGEHCSSVLDPCAQTGTDVGAAGPVAPRESQLWSWQSWDRGRGLRGENGELNNKSKYLAVESSLELQRTLSGSSPPVLNRLSGCWVIVDREIPALWTRLLFAFACFRSPIEVASVNSPLRAQNYCNAPLFVRHCRPLFAHYCATKTIAPSPKLCPEEKFTSKVLLWCRLDGIFFKKKKKSRQKIHFHCTNYLQIQVSDFVELCRRRRRFNTSQNHTWYRLWL